MSPRLGAIYVYPVKSCGSISVGVATTSTTGLEHDRVWQVSVNGEPLTQRQAPVLAQVRPDLIEGGLRLQAPHHGSIDVSDPTAATTEVSALVGMTGPVGDAGDEAAAWFSDLTGETCRLHGLVSGTGFELPPSLDGFGQPIAFSDLAPILLANTASLDHLVASASEPFGMDRFRPNLVIESDQPWAEDTWETITIGEMVLRCHLPWPRCSIPQVDQETAERRSEPAKALRAMRWCKSAPELDQPLRGIVEGSGLFGVSCASTRTGVSVSVGETLDVTETRTPLLAPPT